MPTVKRNPLGSREETVIRTEDLSERLDIDPDSGVKYKLQHKLAYDTRILPEHYTVTTRLTVELHREGRGRSLANSKTFNTKINDKKRLRDKLPFFESKSVAERISEAIDTQEKKAIEFALNHKDCEDQLDKMTDSI